MKEKKKKSKKIDNDQICFKVYLQSEDKDFLFDRLLCGELSCSACAEIECGTWFHNWAFSTKGSKI